MAGGDVVDDVGACCDCSGGDGGTVGVYRNGKGRKRGVGTEKLYCREGAGEFFVWGNLRRVRAGGLASYVKDSDWVRGSKVCLYCWEEF